MLLEAHQLGTIDLHQEKTMISNSLDAILKFRDHNFPLTTPIVDFWRQKFNSHTGFYTQTPTNIAEPVLHLTLSLQFRLRYYGQYFHFVIFSHVVEIWFVIG
jgi:hypothetical protein